MSKRTKQGGWFVLLGSILLLALCVVVGYMLFWLITAFAVKKAKTVKIHDPTSGKRKQKTFTITFGTSTIGNIDDPNHSDVD